MKKNNVVALYPTRVEPWERVMRCRRCHDTVAVVEIPKPFLDKDSYVCGDCLVPVAARKAVA